MLTELGDNVVFSNNSVVLASKSLVINNCDIALTDFFAFKVGLTIFFI